MQNFLSLWLNAGAQITHDGQVQRPRQKGKYTFLLHITLSPRFPNTRARLTLYGQIIWTRYANISQTPHNYITLINENE